MAMAQNDNSPPALHEPAVHQVAAGPAGNPPQHGHLDGSSITYKAWSRSYVEMYTISHEWTIDNFIELDEETQVQFKVTIEGNEELRFKLSIKPR